MPAFAGAAAGTCTLGSRSTYVHRLCHGHHTAPATTLPLLSLLVTHMHVSHRHAVGRCVCGGGGWMRHPVDRVAAVPLWPTLGAAGQPGADSGVERCWLASGAWMGAPCQPDMQFP